MKSKYIKITLNKRNEFRTQANLTIFGDIYNNLDVKIDTGCPQSVVPVSKLSISKDKAAVMKLEAIADKNVKKTIGFGVNDTEEYKKKARKAFNNGNYTDLKSISFKHDITYLEIAGMHLTNNTIMVNYDGVGNILIGMDILKNWDIHIGQSQITGECMMLACPYDILNDEYFKALNEHFGIGDSILTAEMYD